jgi:ribose 5-phosphate isomerase B
MAESICSVKLYKAGLEQHNEHMDKTIYIGCDHAGFELKEHIVSILSRDYEIIDCGPEHLDKGDDYPNFARLVCENVLDNEARGILICDTGIGMSIAANRYQGIRAALVITPFMAERSRLHNDANVLCLGQEVVSQDLNMAFVHTWLTTDFTAVERHIRRLQMLDALG